MSPTRAVKTLHITNMLFFLGLPLIAIIGVPWYARTHGITAADWWLFGVFSVGTMFGITMGYHRLFAHRAFQASRIVRWFCLVAGAAAFEQSALMWASQHRNHHRYVDTPLDPYNIKQGFWHAHMGWMLFWRQYDDFSNVKDLAADPVILHQHKHYIAWAIVTGIVLPLAIGAATGHLVGAALLGVVARLTFIHHSTFCINSVCHSFGKATYDIDSSARDHWIVALITSGEGYHNFHHRFASDYRNGIRWYHWDPSKWLIGLLSWLGLTRKLYRTSPQTILAARAATERVRIERALVAHQRNPAFAALLANIDERYTALKSALQDWEHVEHTYRRLKQSMSEQSHAAMARLKGEIAQRRQLAVEARRRWVNFVVSHPLIPRIAQF